MPSSGVRLARTPDVDDVAAVNVRSWRHRFDGVIPQEFLDAMDPGDLAMMWASAILNPPTPAFRLLVAVDDDRVVGFAAIGPSQDPDASADTGEVIAIEVDPEHLGDGHGSRLVAAAVDHLRAAGTSEVVCWTPVHDEARRSFLQSAGWGPDSAFRDVSVGTDPVGGDIIAREVRLVATLDS